MKFLTKCWLTFLELYDGLTLSQQPLGGSSLGPIKHNPQYHVHQSHGDGSYGDYSEKPVFKAPSSPQGQPFVCDYSGMDNGAYVQCSRADNRGCWLRHKDDPTLNYTIHTNYEDVNTIPRGIMRNYTLDIGRKVLNLDGIDMPHGVVFNNSYPGPWIQACWGDTLNITVKNGLDKYNGTTVHWHGIRQLGSMEMDGVNGVTQCPIAPGKSFSYIFNATQYGTTWYHSHYSIQYGDGLVGPLTIHGPSSADYNDVKDPILMSDWNHRSAFEEFSYLQYSTPNGGRPYMDSMVLDGSGNYANMFNRTKYKLAFEKGRKYLLRLINTSTETTFIFSIDGHNLTIMSSDFVPIEPYQTDHVVIGIGQRYHVVVESIKEFEEHDDKNFWIRTIPANGCSSFEPGNMPDERQGILRYDAADESIPRTHRRDFSLACRDEAYDNLVPIVPWEVGNSNGPNTCTTTSHLTVGITPIMDEENQEKWPKLYGKFARWTVGERPMWLDFSNPSIKQLDLPPSNWTKTSIVIPEGCDEDSWVYLLIIGNTTRSLRDIGVGRSKIAAAHPLHLHGHDFALLQQSSLPYNGTLSLKYYNPPRRDVVLLPADGFVVIAFKADNPGIWLMHCHIAHHASSGLAMQILERQKAIPKRHGWLDQVDRGCKEWDKWFSNSSNLWDSKDPDMFQDDSGI